MYQVINPLIHQSLENDPDSVLPRKKEQTNGEGVDVRVGTGDGVKVDVCVGVTVGTNVLSTGTGVSITEATAWDNVGVTITVCNVS